MIKCLVNIIWWSYADRTHNLFFLKTLDVASARPKRNHVWQYSNQEWKSWQWRKHKKEYKEAWLRTSVDECRLRAWRQRRQPGQSSACFQGRRVLVSQARRPGPASMLERCPCSPGGGEGAPGHSSPVWTPSRSNSPTEAPMRARQGTGQWGTENNLHPQFWG